MGSSDDNSHQLIQSGISTIVTSPPQLLLRGINVEQAFHGSDVSRATFYRRFPTKEKYLQAVVTALIKTNRFDASEARAIAVRHWDESDQDLQAAIRRLVEEGWNAATDSEHVVKQLLAVVFGRATTKDRRELAASYVARDQAVTTIFDVLIGATGATLRKPFTVQSLSAALTAIVDGFLTRHAADQAAVTPTLLTDVILALTNAALTPKHDHGHLYATLDALNPTVEQAELPNNPRAALIDATREEFSRVGYFGATYESIATQASVPLHTARRLFPTKTHVIVGALRPHYERLRTAIEDDVIIGIDETEVLRNHFVRCARLVADERAYMDALMAAVAHDTYSEPDGLLAVKESLNFPGLLVPVIESGQSKGRINSGYAPFDLAAMMTNTLLLRCFTRRGVAPEENAAIVSDLLLDGKLTVPAP